MGVLEIIGGILLIVSSLLMIGLVLMQESKGKGLSGAIGGGESSMGEGRTRSKDAVLANYTKYAAIVFFAVTVLVGVFGIFAK